MSMTLREIAEAANLRRSTIRSYHRQAVEARAKGKATPRHLPPPVGMEDDANVWDDQDIIAWLETRHEPKKRGGVPKKFLMEIRELIEAAELDKAISRIDEVL